MSIATEIQRLQQAKADIAEAIVAKGGEVSGTLDTYAQAIADLPSGNSEHVVEGKFTLASNTYRLSFVNPTGQVPIGVYVEYIGDKVDLCQARFVYTPDQQGIGTMFEWVASSNTYTLHNTKLVDTMSGSSAEFTLGSTECIVRSRAGSRTWLAGEYRYKLFFDVAPSVNAKMVEGEVTVTSETNTVYVYYTADRMPVLATLVTDGEREENKSFGGVVANVKELEQNYRAIFFQNTSGALTSATTFMAYGMGIYSNRIAFSATRNFVAGTYKYRLYFEL